MFTKLKMVAAGAVALLLATAGVLSACGGSSTPASTNGTVYETVDEWWAAEGLATNRAQSAAMTEIIDAVTAERYVTAGAAVTEALGHEDEWAAVYGRCPDPTTAEAGQAAVADEADGLEHVGKAMAAAAVGDWATVHVEMAAGDADLAKSSAHIEAMTARAREMQGM